MGDALTDFLSTRGVHSRPLRALLAALASAPVPFDDLVRASAQPRRTVEELLAACGAEVVSAGGTWRSVESAAQRFLELAEPPPAREAAAAIAGYVADVPTARRALDHVQADAATALRRAEWLDETYWLDGAHLVCVGDHDLTALAACTLRPGLRATVVDVDEALLSYVDSVARERGLDIRCLHADFRFGLPPLAVGSADLVFTDPPYTPEGMRLFLSRGVEALSSLDGRLLVAYGYSARNPALGLKTQREVLDLGLVFEAVLPHFNRYHGAQAVGSASDLYVLQPTSRSPRLAEAGIGIYTHGPQSLEAGDTAPEAVAELLRLTGEGATLLGPGWSEPIRSGNAVAVDLMGDPGPWLARTLVAGPSARLGALVPNNHPDITNAAGQQALKSLVAGKYDIAFHRSLADGKHAVVLATPVATTPGEPTPVRRTLLDRAHGKLANVWREALIRATPGLTKREAKARVEAAAPDLGDLEVRLIDLPLHRLRAVLDASD
ncbi:bis-aminopropyl spermidine synthase family protein [Actinokineospora sp. G85]|uniref:bis-aminopropyl spermidine synthase family protein n=1 Tax=Actinokineospora sp. G85 TaxID=3406626 RepID=UPI003C744D99